MLCFKLNTVENYYVLESGLEAARDENYFRPVAVLFRKKKENETKKR